MMCTRADLSCPWYLWVRHETEAAWRSAAGSASASASDPEALGGDEELEEPARRLGLTGPTLSRDEDRLIVESTSERSQPC